MEQNIHTPINNRDRDFFKFEEMSKQTINKYVEEHPNCEMGTDEGLCEVLSNLLIENVKVVITDKGNISKTLCGHKIKDVRNTDNSLKGISITLYGDYEDKVRNYTNLTQFNEWYEGEIKKCQNKLNKTEENNSVEVKTETQTSKLNSVVFSFEGNEYCFEDFSNVKFVFTKNGDNGIKFSLNRLVS